MRIRTIIISGLLLAVASCLPLSLPAKDGAQEQGQDKDQKVEDKREVHVQVEKTSLLSVSTDRLVIGVTLAVTAKQNVTLEQIVLTNLRMNGIPLYAAPYQGKLELHAEQPLELPDPLRITVYLRDLDSVAPLQHALAEGKMTTEGDGYVTVHLGVLAKMAMLSSRADIPVDVHEEVPFDVPGGPLVHSAALKVLAAAEVALHEVNATVSAGEQRFSAFRKDVAQNYARYVMFAYARYDLRDSAGQTTTVEWSGVGLRFSANRLLITKEAFQPWKFDAEIAAAIRSKELSLAPESYDLWVWPSSAQITNGSGLNFDAGLRYSRQQVTLVNMPGDETTMMVGLKKSGHAFKVPVDRRNAASNLALLEIASTDALPGPVKIADLTAAAAVKWDTVAVFRFRAGRSGAGGSPPDVIFMPAVKVRDGIRLEEPVDQSAYGSPIVSPEGVIGIVQDHDGGVVWSRAAKALKLSQTEVARK